ncbi:MAG: bifunctional [glutamine synthetase] adenylyltransferase/[glutamine synthetase]-adenylyl-L-tyrosine phosphorylase [Beijerinckiaceae bacterium]
MSGLPIARTLRGRIVSTPLLAHRADGLKLCKLKLLDLLDDRDAAGTLDHTLREKPKTLALVAGVVAHSPFLMRIVRQHPDWLIESLDDDPDDRFAGLLSQVRALGPKAEKLEDAMAQLRTLRQCIALHIALADLAGVWTVDRVVEALTQFADAAVDIALRLSLREAARAGRLQLDAAFEHPERSGLTILAMGKHGAHELNYSSDIDLIVLFDPAAVPVAEGREPLDVAIRIIKDVVKILHEQTGSGYVFRTDLRLRPDPASTPIAVSIDRAISYYQTVGQNWERAALIKARAIAGDIAMGESFLQELVPFIWRRYFDYAAIADIHAMKRQIHAHKGGAVVAVEGHNVKLGRGGIREIEFFVQTQQLVFGGRKPVLRGRQTLAMLQKIRDEGWIGSGEVEELSAAYRFLRMVEHRLQMVDDEQTQKLPSGKAGIDQIALFCGLMPAAFRKVLTGHLLNVERCYAKLFEDAPALSAGKGNLVFTGSTDDPETLKTLRKMGFQRPDLVAETVRGWHFGRRQAIVTQRAREVLTELVPALLEAFGQSSDPDGAVIALDHAMQGMPAVVELFTLLKQNAALRTLFAEILGNAPRLSQVVVQRPHVLDALIDPEFAKAVSEEEIIRRFEFQLSRLESMEDFLDQIRDLARAKRFLIGARLLSGLSDPLEAGSAYAAVATAAIRSCLQRVTAELSRRHGVVPGASLAVVGLGKLGGREMTALSDLDIMLVYDVPEADAESDGEKPLYASEWYSRLTQRLVTALTVATKRGSLYDVDLRLRPSGSKGPVAVTLDAFRQYHSAESETWERMALTRARVVAGDAPFAEKVEAAIKATFDRKTSANTLAKDILSMRQLMAKEKPAKSHWDLKLANGGLVDIEFVAQHLSLRHGALHPAVLHPGTEACLLRLKENGLLSPETCSVLVEAHRLQSALAQLIALGDAIPFDPAAARPAFRRRLAATVNLPDFKVLEGALLAHQAQAHAAMNALLNVQ